MKERKGGKRARRVGGGGGFDYDDDDWRRSVYALFVLGKGEGGRVVVWGEEEGGRAVWCKVLFDN